MHPAVAVQETGTSISANKLPAALQHDETQ